MKLVIAEKPSLARAIMTSIGEKFENKGEYYQSKNYYVVPLHGHIMETVDMEKYPDNKGKDMWKKENLPFFPKKYKYAVMRGEKKTLDAIKKIDNLKGVTEVLHCGDPDREGQVIVDTVLAAIGNKKKVTRPLLKATTPEAIKESFKERKDNSLYKLWSEEGLVRSYIDWDFGINLSRYAYAKTKAGLNVGRVIGAIVTEIYNRDKEIEEFVPEDYFKIESDVDGIKLTSKQKPKDKKEAEEYCKKLNKADAIVTDLSTKKVTKAKPKLFTQTMLQGEASKKFNLKPQTTLAIAQSLYEKGLTTYPRTNTSYIAEGERKFVEDVIKSFNDKGIKISSEPFDDSKVDGHSAIMPTDKRGSLSGNEEKVYNMIVNRFKAVFCVEPCTVNKTTAKISVGKIEDFTVSGETPITLGWKKYEGKKAEDTTLPPLKIGQKINHDFKATATQTKPPAHYNVDSLGKWMEDPFRKSEEDEADYKNILAGLQIGTEATRAGIIEKALKKNYIQLKDKVYTIQPQGKFLVESCRDMGIDMSKEKTAEMGKWTKDVSKGKRKKEEVLQEVRKEITKIIKADKSTSATSEYKCPNCGKELKDEYMKLSCDCGFTLWKTIAKKRLTPKDINDLLTKGKTDVIEGFQGKKGKFNASVVLEKGETKFEFAEKEELGKCPLCGKPILENAKAYGCSGWRDGCKFVIWKTSKYPKARITKDMAIKLLQGETVRAKNFTAKLKSDNTGIDITES